MVDRIDAHVGGEHTVFDRAQVLVGRPVGGGELHQFLTDGSHPVVEGGEALLEPRPFGHGGIELGLEFGGLFGLQFGGLLDLQFGGLLGLAFGGLLGLQFGDPLSLGGCSLLLLAVEQRRPRSCRRDRTVPDYGEPIMASTVPHQIHLSEAEMPTQWYNLIADLPTPPPPALHPGTHQPAGPDDFAPLFPMALIEQEVTTERYIDIPGGVLDVYRLWRPSPLFRAHRLEELLDTPARIYYKYEGVSPAGSHKPNTAVPQAYYNHQEGITKLTTETGAGQWGSALAFATSQYGMECEIWQVAASYRQKPYRKTMMEIWGATLHSSPSELTEFGRSLLAENPDHPGSLGIAISEAVAMCVADPNARYALGSVLNHVLLHQTIIGEEALLQLAKVDETPDVLVGCTGGGSNFGGLAFPFLREKLAGKMNPTIRCVEPAACPTLTKGEYRYDFGDTAGMTPLMKMHTLGHTFIPEPIHAGGLRYHGMSPLVSHVYNEGLVEAIAIPQRECFAGALQFARTEGIVPAPEPTHAIAAAIREALACKESGEEKVILTALCGHGHLDLASYEKYLSGEMVDYDLPDSVIADAMASVPVIA